MPPPESPPESLRPPKKQQGASETAPKARNKLRRLSEAVDETPKAEYLYKRSVYDIPEKTDRKKFDGSVWYLRSNISDPKVTKIHASIQGTADKIYFNTEQKNKSKDKVELYKDDASRTKWRNDFLRALVILKAQGTLPALDGANFVTKNLEAIHDLPIGDQQEAMNHAIAYLRAETLRDALIKECGNVKVEYTIRTKWATDTVTRRAAILAISVEKAPPSGSDWSPAVDLPPDWGI